MFALSCLQQAASGLVQPSQHIVVSALRLIETHATPCQGAATSKTLVCSPAASTSSREPASEQADTQKSDSVLGLLTSLLHQQQQQQQHSSQHSSQQQQQDHGSGALSSTAQAAMQWPSSSSQLLDSTAACQPDLAAASSGVRMESQLVFDSCWRRFREKRGMVSTLCEVLLIARLGNHMLIRPGGATNNRGLRDGTIRPAVAAQPLHLPEGLIGVNCSLAKLDALADVLILLCAGLCCSQGDCVAQWGPWFRQGERQRLQWVQPA